MFGELMRSLDTVSLSKLQSCNLLRLQVRTVRMLLNDGVSISQFIIAGLKLERGLRCAG